LSISGFCTDDNRTLSGVPVTELPDIAYADPGCTSLLTAQFKKEGLYDLKERPLALSASGGLVYYLSDTQKTSLAHITSVGIYDIGKYMVLDSFTRRNLELTETLRDKEKKGSLLSVLDRTKTAMGARELRSMIEQPLLIASDIISRSDAVSILYDDIVLREELREYLNPIRDLERLMARIAYGSVNPKEMVSFAASLRMLPDVKAQLSEVKSGLLHEIYEKLDTLSDICELISSTICDDPPLTVREGGIVREGYSEEVDRLRKARTEGKNWLAQLEQKERERTGIKTLKIKYSHVFGYCFEVTNTFKELVPDDYVRRQTLVNAERFTSEKLKEMEETILGAEDRLSNLEYDIFKMVRETVSDNVLRVKQTAKAIGYVDALASLAAVAALHGYVRPKINTNGVITIKGGRHPVVEEMLGSGSFVKNDTLLDSDANAISVITGPNMAGKSTYMRQCALIVLMAQIGSFVPADEADICVCDRIFTRVGASDDLASGQSTFMVEMNEVANILNNATSDSLLILDEIGRGTSTFDGLAIAWSVIEYINSNIKAKTLFATHYHELTELEGKLHGVQNYCIAVKESGDDIVFLRKIMKGGADKSYGIQVAKLAGLPDEMLNRAKEIVSMLNDADINQKTADIAANVQTTVKPASSTEKSNIEKTLANIDVERLTPLEALNLIYDLKSELDK
ncbi:MAG: DNA mismatch repair protein MutS, partial [Lachnospiraceae bacterium]|nr:DNA mismatch repair protein MutS [Candidatus Minthocola equi]